MISLCDSLVLIGVLGTCRLFLRYSEAWLQRGTGGALAGAGAGRGGERSTTDCLLVGDDTGEGLGVEVT